VPDDKVSAGLQRLAHGGDFPGQPDIVLVREQDDIGIGPTRGRDEIARIAKPSLVTMDRDRNRRVRSKSLDQRRRRVGRAIVRHHKAVGPARLVGETGQLGDDESFALAGRRDDGDA